MDLRKQSELMTHSELWQKKCQRCNQLEQELLQKDNYIQYLRGYQKILNVQVDANETSKFTGELSQYNKIINELQLQLNKQIKEIESLTKENMLINDHYLLQMDKLNNEYKFQLKNYEIQLNSKSDLMVKMHQDFIEQLEKDLSHHKTPDILESKFIKSLLTTIAACHPENYFKDKLPTLKQAQKWIKFLLTDYMRLKQQQLQ